MKMKMLSLQMIPHCFPLKLGNNRSLQSDGGKGTIKLIKYDGTVKIYSRPIHVSEVLNEHPKYMVCPSDSFYIGQKIPSLSLHDKLRMKAAQPFDIQKTASGSLRIRVSENFITQLIEQGRHGTDPIGAGQICNTPELQKDYQQLVGQRRQYWKPKLDTISERHKKKISVSVKRNKKQHHHASSQTQTLQTPVKAQAAGAGSGRSSKHPPNHHRKTSSLLN